MWWQHLALRWYLWQDLWLGGSRRKCRTLDLLTSAHLSFSPTSISTGMVAVLLSLLFSGTSEQTAFRRFPEFQNHL